ncbi:hypothetical protein ICE98_02442 [Lactococcus lactis]|nr:hypothetical protein [Lactococcus lactis]
MMLNNKMFHREHQYQETVKGSGADFVEELKPYLDENTIITSPTKSSVPNQMTWRFNSVKTALILLSLAGMNANLCVDSHLRELVESGFHVHVAADATGAPGQEAYEQQ